MAHIIVGDSGGRSLSVKGILSILRPEVQLESGTGSRGGVYIRLVRMAHRASPDSRKSGPGRRGEGKVGREVVWTVFSSREANDGDCVASGSHLYICPRDLYYNK